ncbi:MULTISPECIES: hypothetical protein [Marinobacter]|uniref:hypothetical protein n=1 Tax=Marinobacter TaxID=2742 RepID=UPI001108AD2E|nr:MULTISPECIES: hypothetical protein [Marinobacter]MCK2149585.1 hypothetical protein [Marinobacter alexandrii]
MAVSYGKARQRALGLVLASMLMSGQAWALAPEHETRRLMLATEEAVTSERWGDAGEYLNRLQQLEGTKPADYFFYRGRVMHQAGHLNEAQSALEAYVESAGTDGSHYQKALKLITEVEKVRKEQAAAPQNGNGESSKVAVIEPAGVEETASLRELYLVNSDREALALHLNSLLEVAGWREDQTIVQLDESADVEYRVRAESSAINLQEIRRDAQGRMVRTTQTISVYGVNPQVEWGCEAAATTCWVYDPRDGSRLLQLSLDRDRTQEIARTFGKLIRNLQNPAGS